MAVSLPYNVIKAIEDAVPQSEQAEKVIRAIEQSLCAIRKEAQDREALVKAQVEEAGFTIFNPGFMQIIKTILGFIH